MSEWNATMYDNKHDFVAEYGKGLLEYIPQNEKQSIFFSPCPHSFYTQRSAGCPKHRCT